jgi:hypothetical protein
MFEVFIYVLLLIINSNKIRQMAMSYKISTIVSIACRSLGVDIQGTLARRRSPVNQTTIMKTITSSQ